MVCAVESTFAPTQPFGEPHGRERWIEREGRHMGRRGEHLK
jgi:hypothetical protein